MKVTKLSVTYVIYNDNRSKILLVKRPHNDNSLPNIWGLPAGSLMKNESFEACVIRSGKEKLGVQLKPLELSNEGQIEREDYIIHMKEYEVKITNGTPKVPQHVFGITQYQDWKWAEPKLLREAAKKGSLCAQLYLSNIKLRW